MSMDSIRRRYGVPAKRGMAVIVDGQPATITGSSRTAEHLMVRFDDDPRRTHPIHPTWRVEYGRKDPAARASGDPVGAPLDTATEGSLR